MPINIALIVAGIAAVFIVFAITLAWADRYTRAARHPGPAE